MKTEHLHTSIKDLYLGYRLQQRELSEKIKRDEAKVLQYAPAYQALKRQEADAETQKVRTQILGTFKPKLADLKGWIASERKQFRLDIGRVRFPGLTSKDPSERAIAESQINSALLFLSTPHSAEAIASALRDAIDLNRTDFAFTLIDNVLAGIPKDISGQDAPSEAQKVLLSEIMEIENSFDGKGKLDELEAELKKLPALQTMADDFQRQVEAGSQAVILPELFPSLSEEERNGMLQDIEARGNITEHVHFKQRIHKAMTEHG
jgi:hypothetical protein